MKIENKWEHQYSTLDEEDRANPFRVLMFFTAGDTVFDTRNMIYHLFHAAMISRQFELDKPEEKGSKMRFYMSLLRLIEACYLIDELIEKGQLTYRLGSTKKK